MKNNLHFYPKYGTRILWCGFQVSHLIFIKPSTLHTQLYFTLGYYYWHYLSSSASFA